MHVRHAAMTAVVAGLLAGTAVMTPCKDPNLLTARLANGTR